MARLWRVWHEQLPSEAGTVVQLDDDEAHHVLRVLRLGCGDVLALFDGRGREWRATLVETAGGAAAARLDELLDAPIVEPALEVILYQALLRPERMDWVLQKGTELGVSGIRAFPAERSEGTRGVRPERWRRIAIEACKQSGRRRLPELSSVGALPAPEPGSPAWLLDPTATVPLGRVLSGHPVERVWLAAGPEAGFSAGEVARARSTGWKPVSLGPRVLRAETAGVIALAIVLHRWADLGAD